MTKKLFFTLTITALFFTNCATRQASVAEALTVVEALETTATHDYGVVINGIRWATRNVDAPGTFAPYPESSGMFFQKIDLTRIGNPCPQGWRLPTADEFESLANVNNVWATKNGINGSLFGNVPNQIFFPAVGFISCFRGEDYCGDVNRANTHGHYWSSTVRNINDYGYIVLGGGNIYFQYSFRFDEDSTNIESIVVSRTRIRLSIPIRCVAK